MAPGAYALLAPPTHSKTTAKTSPAVRAWMRSLSLRDRVAQLVVVPFYGETPNSRTEEFRKYVRWVRDLRVGGLVLVNRVRNGSVQHSEPYAMAAFLNRMQKLARIPLIVAGDFERGDSMRVESETKPPHAMAFAATRDPSLSRWAGGLTARQGRALGAPWIFAPVSDVNNNPDNPIVNIRSYGENPEEVAAHVRAFIEGAHAAGPVLVTAKHFPGHGDTSTDSHIALAVSGADKARLEAVEMVPFRAAIAAGVDSVMTAHIAVPALDQPNVPSTLSHAVLTGLLRDELGFHGLVVTDAMDMSGIAKQWSTPQAAAKAIEAGVDVLLMPPDPEAAVDGVLHAMQQGRISRQRLDESVARVLAAKVRLELNRRKLVDVETAMDALDAPEDLAKVQEVADRAVTLVKNERDAVPLARGGAPLFLMLRESRCAEQGRAFAGEAHRLLPNAVVTPLDPSLSDADIDQAAAAAKSASVVVVAAFVSVASYRGTVALAGNYPKLMGAVLAAGPPVVLAALGNPYLLRSFPAVAAYLATYSTVPPSEIALARALFGEIAIGGRLPVTIPGAAKYGDGIQVGKKSL
jgi:beta-N-acetylhexosaminidase